MEQVSILNQHELKSECQIHALTVIYKVIIMVRKNPKNRSVFQVKSSKSSFYFSDPTLSYYKYNAFPTR